MNTIPIDSFDGAAEYFTFGPGALGTWLSLAVALALFLALIVRAVRQESRSFAALVEPGLDEEWAAQESITDEASLLPQR